MNKRTFLKTLAKELRPLNSSELQKNINYYEEIIADMTENGLSEEDAVKKIGSPKQIAQEILENTPPENMRKKDRAGRILIGASIVALILSVISGIRKYFMIDASIAIIGGADGPTSIFLAGRVGDSPEMWMIAALLILITVIYKIYRAYKEKRP